MKKISLVLVIIMLAAIFAGCDKQTISNDYITIKDYKKIKIEDPTDEEGVWQALLEHCIKFECPQEELNNLIGELETEYSYVAYSQGKTGGELIEQMYGITVEKLAEEQLKKQYAIALIAQEENLNLSDEEYQKELEGRAKASGFDEAKDYENVLGKEKTYQKILEERILEFLIK